MLQSPRKPGAEADGLGQLKLLLFRGEADRLRSVEERIDAIDGRVGDAPRLEAATSEILVEALRRAEVARHRELAAAIAPVVVASIRNEIKNSREMMVEALYPLTGQLVVAAVSNAFREMIAAMNERLDSLTSVDRWKLTLRARFSGRPVGELALTTQAPRPLRVLFIERQSGSLLASWRADGEPDNRGELVAGLMSALMGFARNALGQGGGDLRALDFAGRDIYVHASPAHLIATEVDRQLRTEERASLDRDCLAWLEQYARDGKVDDKIFADFIELALEKARRKRKKAMGWPIKIVAGALAIVVLGFATRSALRESREYALRGAMARVIDARPSLGAYPLGLKIDHTAGHVELRGLAPARADVDSLAGALREAAAGYVVEDNVGIVATEQSIAEDRARTEAAAKALSGNMDARTTRLSSEFDDRLASLSARIDALAKSAASIEDVAIARAEQARMADAAREFAGKLAVVDAGLGDVRKRSETPRARLADLIDGFAIFFDRDQIIERAGLRDRLAAIADVLNQSGLGLRVIGYSDDSGSATGNQKISRRRADVIVDLLAERGATRDRLSPVGRATANLVADGTLGARERNRRVTFELADNGEITP